MTRADRFSQVRGSSQGDRVSLREGARSKTPPGTPRKGGKLLSVRVQMLDDSITLFQVQVQTYFFLLRGLPQGTSFLVEYYPALCTLSQSEYNAVIMVQPFCL